jgi:threonylcarbamoyladenosine tRNA methylthiotransferase MtaB
MADFLVENFGCRASRADGEAIAARLRAMCEREPLGADVVVVNTCSVTAEADRAARAFIRRARRRNPEAKIVVTGCYAQRAPQELAAMPGVAAVVGNSHKALTPEIVFDLARADVGTAESAFVPLLSLFAAGRPGAAGVWADDRFAHSFIEAAGPGDVHSGQLSGGQTRPNLKIQEGCGNRCTFCVIPLTRGPSRSLPAASVLRQVAEFVASGGKELVLSGINLGRWGRDLEADPTLATKTNASRGWGTHLESPSLAGLVREIFERTELPLLRLSSVEPMDWDDEMVALMREFGGRRLARHAHLPLQSGSDAVLRRMHRRYRPWHYAGKVASLLEAAGKDLTLGADVMAGFPGETDREFEETVEFVRALPFGYLHLFPFSARPGTQGWALHAASPVAATVMEERMAVLRALAAEKVSLHRSRFVGQAMNAITLHTARELAVGVGTAALTENFIPVELKGKFAANRLLAIRVTRLSARAELLAHEEGSNIQ